MKTLVICPRLDISWKDKDAPTQVGKIKPEYKVIRGYWKKFIDRIGGDYLYHPLGGLTPDIVKGVSGDYDFVYVPHRQKKQFDCGPKALYYMQMVFPWLFSIDEEGWCAGSSVYPIQPEYHDNHPNYEFLLDHVNSGNTKFKQKNTFKDYPSGEFILYTLQLPHDLTIEYHSSVAVIDGLRRTLEFGKKMGIGVLVKPHVGKGQDQFKKVLDEVQWGSWAKDAHIHQCIKKATAVCTVNSGTGMEAIVMNKPVFAFGNAEYDAVAFKELTEKTWNDRNKYTPQYKDFIETYYSHMIDLGKY